MPNYNPKDMAMMLQISKKGAMTPQEQALMQNINTAMQPEIAAGNVGMMPQAMPGSMSNADMAAMQRQATPIQNAFIKNLNSLFESMVFYFYYE
jgi:hypothetical protein